MNDEEYIKKLEETNQQLEKEVVETRAISKNIKKFLYYAITDLDQYFRQTQISQANKEYYSTFHNYMEAEIKEIHSRAFDFEDPKNAKVLHPEYRYIIQELERLALDKEKIPDRIYADMEINSLLEWGKKKDP